MREVLTRYGRHNIGFLWLFVEPMMFTLGVTALWTAIRADHGSDLPIVAFAITGYSSVLLWRNMPARCAGSIGPNLALMYHRNVKVIDIFASRLLLEIGGVTTSSFAVLTLLFLGIGWMKLPEDMLLVVLGWLLLTWFGARWLILIGCAQRAQRRSSRRSGIRCPTCCSRCRAPPSWSTGCRPRRRSIILLLPMVHGVELLRDGFFRLARPRALRPGLRQRVLPVPDAARAQPGARDQPQGHARMIVMRDVVKRIPDPHGPVTVLDHINLLVRPGEKVGILGRNGAGKSTMIRLISGAERPTSGAIRRGMSVSWPLAFGGALPGLR